MEKQRYLIQDFWKKRISITEKAPKLIRGWSHQIEGLETFCEAPLTLSDDLSAKVGPEDASILLVSAPGAVGKSTLAKQISYETGAIYLDLAEADAVGGNTLSGGVFKCGLGNLWESGSAAILIDGLDEARLRVTQEAFEAFVSDVSQLAQGRSVPTVLFGRTGSVQDTYLALLFKGIEVPVLEVGFYESASAIEFSMAAIKNQKLDRSNEIVERKAVTGLLGGLRKQTENDGDRFAGYAPVLKAVADYVAKSSNPQTIVSEIDRGEKPITLDGVTSAILEREHAKLKNITFSDATLADRLYLKEEQFDRLAARVYGAPKPPALPMQPDDAALYDSAITTWVEEHPFIGANGQPSSAVFDAIICAWALKHRNADINEAALKRELGKGAAANPFLAEFYQSNLANKGVIPPHHIGVLYSSLRAGLSLGDTASLTIESDDDLLEEEALRAEVEISMSRKGSGVPRVIGFSTEQTAPILVGSHVENIDIYAPYASVACGPGAETTFVAPVTIQCEKLLINTSVVVVEGTANEGSGNSVYLEASQYSGDSLTSVPVIRGDVKLAACWPGAKAHPWTSFASEPTLVEDPREDEALRRFRKFVISFRSHSKGNLARYKNKIEHARMTKGLGRKVLNSLVSDEIVVLIGSMYYLKSQTLAEIAGASFHDCARKNFNDKTRQYIKGVLER